MSIRTKIVTIQGDPAENRDAGKSFFLREMPARQAEKWAIRALNLLAASGFEVPDSAAHAGLAGLASVGVDLSNFRGLDWEKLEPLLDEMLGCVSSLPNPANVGVIVPLVAGSEQIEEVKTLLTLRKEVLELHLGFSLADKFRSLSAAKTQSDPQTSSPTSQA